MKLRTLCATSFALIMGLVSCTTPHLISDASQRNIVAQDFQTRKEKLPEGDLFSVLDREDLSQEQREALTFLYAYMPLADITDHSGDYFLEQVNYSLRAREEMPWGHSIPELEFRHFVLPSRVNNENLDDCRKVFYEELKDRIKHLSLHDAVLEINHWCHEKVVYTPSDGRTSSPLASIKTAHARCGEESTFTVSALRAMGIPARQVYTPRWAHTDDNHAWVEAWVDGRWYFLGACEPEPVLNLAWFNAPVSRGMMMHTRVFGHYNSREEVMSRTSLTTHINVTENYAPVAKADLRVVDLAGNPVADASVEFKVYNYGEFYTVSRKTTDAEGRTFLSAGKGDLLVWVSKDGHFGFSKLSFGKDHEKTIVLDKKPGDAFDLQMDIIPPVEGANMPEVSDEQRAENTRRMIQEDEIRNAYIATFVSETEARKRARAWGLDEDRVARLLVASRGNHEVISMFLAELSTPRLQEAGLDLLERVAQKDLRDATIDVLRDHLNTPIPDLDNETFREYVRNPRVALEMLTPYKHFFRQAISEEQQEAFRQAPLSLAKWVKDHIRIDPECNLGAIPISPAGVWRARTADQRSRNIFFVSVARALGIPARIDEVTGKVQLMGGKHPIDVDFEVSEEIIAPTGTLKVGYKPIEALDDPKYYTHFTISKINEDGTTRLQMYEEGELDMGGGTTWAKVFKRGTKMDVGHYQLITGTRLASGGVLATIKSFSIREGQTTHTNLVMRDSEDDIRVIGSFNSEDLFTPVTASERQSILSATGRGYYIVGVLGMGQEPTNHALRDLAARSKELEKWGRKIVLLFTDEAHYKMFRKEDFPNLPRNIVFGIDADGSIRNEILREMKRTDKTTLPLFIIGDTFNRVVFVSQGYTIGLGDQLLKVIHKL